MCITIERYKTVKDCLKYNKQYQQEKRKQELKRKGTRNFIKANNIFFRYLHWIDNEKDY